MSVPTICNCGKCGKTALVYLPNHEEFWYKNYLCDNCFYEDTKNNRKQNNKRK